ncbi:lysophospholipase L1-like esterase [Streptomyces sp. Amel2xB2]|uniref:SGNH/GDSL hydrolase family protein n=1 Tax=Streptomyces sp. Amel2xB2 TaxID=1305829 RepID=UPI000DB9973A|nr:SGNH/GDSL hydrolase family protein [Streptomyces sp. Amel2xB2]RAJ70160.1 lysophospholipase L1-like esterase [Streptomyces sp. Amel2xB2]
MPENHGSTVTVPGTAGRITRRGRGVAVIVVALLLIGGLALAALWSSGSGGFTGERPPGGARPSPSPTPPWDRHPDSVAAVGDSITQGFDACSLLADCTRASWVTGTDPGVRSLASRLIDDAPSRHSWNFAVSGSVMADLPAQMERAARKRPELVTVLAGANDACRPTVGQMTPVSELRADFRSALRTLHTARPKTQVYVASLPDLKRLWSQGRGDPWGARVWGLGICQSMLRDPQSTTPAARERRQQVHERVIAYNSALEQECARFLRCRYDGGAVFRYRFTKKEVSRWDWFHPSKAGQRKLAELAYRGITARQPASASRDFGQPSP